MICRICRKAEGEWLADDGTVLHSCPLAGREKTVKTLNETTGMLAIHAGKSIRIRSPMATRISYANHAEKKGLRP